MKCISIRQPWAALILMGEKTIEIRSRRFGLTPGEALAIHASKFTAPDIEKFMAENVPLRLRGRGMVLGQVVFTGLKKYTTAAEFNADGDLHLCPEVSASEFTPCYGLIFSQPRIFRYPKIMPGHLGIFQADLSDRIILDK